MLLPTSRDRESKRQNHGDRGTTAEIVAECGAEAASGTGAGSDAGADMGEPSAGRYEAFSGNATDKEIQFPSTRG